MNNKTSKMVKLAVLAALGATLIFFIRFPIIPSAPFLEYEPGDVAALIGSFMYGPAAGLTVTIIMAFIQALTVSSGSGWVGFIMHIISTGTLVTVAGFLYLRNRTYKGAIIGLIAGTLSMIAVMIPANLFFTVHFWGMPAETVKNMIVPALIPFNLIKGAVNSTITVLVYKTIAGILREPKIKKKGLERKNVLGDNSTSS
ncbi:MAG: ECF transporter S component [Halanaerobiaceae bacterium]